MFKISDFSYVHPYYTGGNIYNYMGQMKNGDYFFADDSIYEVDFIDTGPEDYDSNTFYDNVFLDKHHVAEIPSEEDAHEFFKSMFKWILKHRPDGAYEYYDMEDRLKEFSTGGWF